MAGGRPSNYTPELAAEICKRLRSNPSLRALCRASDMPSRECIGDWVHKHEQFAGQYARARQDGWHDVAEEILEIADEGQYDMTEDEDGKPITNWEHIKRTQIRIDARKWWVSKCLPKIYGDRVAQEISGPDGGPVEMKGTPQLIPMEPEAWLEMVQRGKCTPK